MDSSNCILIFARAPQLGRGKTRLSKDLGAALTLELYKNMLQILALNLKGLPYFVIYHNEEDDIEALNCLKFIFKDAHGFDSQPRGDLGFKMQTMSQKYFDIGYKKVILLGSDTPHVFKPEIERVFTLLETNNQAIGPACDGGYWLLGMNSLAPASIFKNMEWGQDSVFYETYSRLLNSKNQVQLISKKNDLDFLDDIERIMKEYPLLFDKELIHKVQKYLVD